MWHFDLYTFDTSNVCVRFIFIGTVSVRFVDLNEVSFNNCCANVLLIMCLVWS